MNDQTGRVKKENCKKRVNAQRGSKKCNEGVIFGVLSYVWKKAFRVDGWGMLDVYSAAV